MPVDGVRFLDLDGSLNSQSRLREIGGEIDVVDMRDMAPHLRYMTTRSWMRRFRTMLKPAQRHRLTFHGSGDFHHLSAAMVAQWRTPLSVVVFDNHPDWDITAPWPCCGNWVNSILAIPTVQKVVVIGPGRPDLHGWHLLRGNLAALRRGALEVYPASWECSRALGIGDVELPEYTTRRQGIVTQVQWHTVKNMGWNNLMERVVNGLPTHEVYVSVDKDCLLGAEAITNWEEGELSLMDVARAIERLGRDREIVGADITGEYSVGSIRNPLFRFIAQCDHPARALPSTRDLERNEQANLILLDAFRNVASLQP